MTVSRLARALTVAFASALALVLAACSPKPPRDAVDENTTEERRSDARPGNDAYEHVARRTHATVALAEARGLDPQEAHAAVDALADKLETCTRDLTADQNGLLRLVARVADDGTVDAVSVPVQSGHAPTALRCVVSPIKLLIFQKLPPRAEGTKSRGLALEVEWRPG